MNTRKGTSFVVRLLLVCIPTALTLLVADLAYRSISHRGDVIPRKIGRHDDTLGWALKPGVSAYSSATGSRVRYSINSKGLRDSETEYAKPSGTLRIALVGDSRTFGYGVAIEHHFSNLLEGYFRDLEVINLGVQGYGVDQELLILQREGMKYQPDVVIAYVAHFGNYRHMFANRWGQPKPMFKVQDGALVLIGVPVPYTDTVGPTVIHRADAFLTTASPLYRDVSGAAARLVSRILRGEAPAPLVPTEGTSAVDSTFENEAYEMGLVIVQQMNAVATQAGARFVLVTELPRLHRLCIGLGIASVDVAAAMANPRFELPRGLQHVTEAGNGVLASEIARYLTESGLIPLSRRTAAVGAEPPS